MAEERLKLAVYVDFDNIQIGLKDTLGKDFDVSLVLEALKERGEVVTKVAYGDWPRAGEQSRQMTQHAVQMVQRNVTPRGDKNGADINLALDALEMAFTRHHINAFAIVGGDSDFIALVEKLKQYDKRVFVVGGRAFTSQILQRNCTEFIAYENLLHSATSDGGRTRSSRRGGTAARAAAEGRPLPEAFPNVQRALKILAEREVAPQIGLLKSTLLQLDSTFSERDFGAASFLEFMQKMERARLVHLRKTDRGFLVEPANGEGEKRTEPAETSSPEAQDQRASEAAVPDSASPAATAQVNGAEAMELLKQALVVAHTKAPSRPLYLRQVRQALRSADRSFDERRYGQRGVLDLLYQAQREGLIRLQRDRKGILRIFLATPLTPAPSTETEPITEPVQEAPAAATLKPAAPEAESSTATSDEVIEAAFLPEVAGPVAEEVMSEAAPEKKTRKSRVAGSKGRRRTSTPRKSKESSTSA